MLTSQSVRHLIEAVDPKTNVLSVYLDINSATGLWKQKVYAFEKELERLDAALETPIQRRQFAAEQQKVLAFVRDFKSHGKSLVIFSSAPQQLWWTTTLHVDCPQSVHYGAGPEVGPLEALLDEHQPYGVGLVDHAHARLFTVQMGEIGEQRGIKSRVPAHHKRTGFKSRLQHRHDEKEQLHLRRVITGLKALHRDTGIRRLVLGGAVEPIALLQAQLPKELNSIVVGTFRAPLYASNSQVLGEAAQVEALFEAQKESRTIEELLTRGSRHGSAVLGADETLLALYRGEAFELVVAAGYHQKGCACPKCGFAATTLERACPLCSSRTERSADVVELAIKKAALAGVRVEVVTGPARERLVATGSMGALLKPKSR